MSVLHIVDDMVWVGLTKHRMGTEWDQMESEWDQMGTESRYRVKSTISHIIIKKAQL